MVGKESNNCKDLNCVCFDCPNRGICHTNKCPGMDNSLNCEGFYLCNESKRDSHKQQGKN
jgi:hypothetical protein